MDEILKLKENIVELSAKNEALKREMDILQQRIYSLEYINRRLINSILEENGIYSAEVDKYNKLCMVELLSKI